MVSSSEAVSSTKITCGSQSGTLDDFCDSVVMNNDQSHIPKMLSVDQLEPIWNLIAQIDPWLGDAMQGPDRHVLEPTCCVAQWGGATKCGAFEEAGGIPGRCNNNWSQHCDSDGQCPPYTPPPQASPE